jgi:sulfite dehydrogenase (quinone) subunit SoeC
MHPAPSVILFTVLSGMGFGLLTFLGFGDAVASGWPAFLLWGLGYGLAVGGLLASTTHLGNPQRALLAFSQWRSSWLSREAWISVAALVVLAPVALSDWLGLGMSRVPGMVGGALALGTVFTTSMIYTQLATIPRWNHWSTPVMFLSFAVTGGALLSGHQGLALLALAGLAGVLVFTFIDGQTRFARRAQTIGTATGLDRIGAVSVFEQPHTSPNYLMKEMIHIVGRKHASKLEVIAVSLAAVVPILALLILPAPYGLILAIAAHLMGALTQRWLFFAQAEHVVGLFYGQR